MIKNSFIIRKYTFILFSTAEYLNISSLLIHEIHRINNFLLQRCIFFKLINNSYVSQRTKFLICSILFCHIQISLLMKNFILLLIRNNSFYIFSKVLLMYRVYFLQKLNFSVVNIVLPKICCKNEIIRTREFFFHFLKGKNFIFNFYYDSNILDGFIFFINMEKLNFSTAFKFTLLTEIIKNKI